MTFGNDIVFEYVKAKMKLIILLSITVNLILLLFLNMNKSRDVHACEQEALALRAEYSSLALDPAKLEVPPLRASEEEFLRSARITHLIIPFHARQEDSVESIVKYFKRFPPCSDPRVALEDHEGASYFRRKLDHPLGWNITLVFYVSSPPDLQLKWRLETFVEGLPMNAKRCFSSVQTIFISIPEGQDNHLVGSRMMFEKMINHQIGLVNPRYIFYMEPDCLPLRPYWLSVIDSLTRYPNKNFWMKGSIFRGPLDAIYEAKVFHKIHINGNAIYNLADKRFVEYYFKEVRPVIKRYYENGGYDGDFARLYTRPEAINRTREIAHHFQFSDFIQNHWHGEYQPAVIRNTSDITVLIHGGYIKEPGVRLVLV